MLGKPTQRSGKGREAYPKVREGLRGQPGGPGGVKTPTCRSRMGKKSDQEVRERSGVPPKRPGGIERPT